MNTEKRKEMIEYNERMKENGNFKRYINCEVKNQQRKERITRKSRYTRISNDTEIVEKRSNREKRKRNRKE